MWIVRNFRRAAIVAAGLFLAVLGVIGTTMIVNAVIIGLITVLGLLMLLAKLPPRVRELMLKHPLPTDIVLSVLCFVMFGMGGTITGLAAGSIAALSVSALILLLSELRTAGIIPGPVRRS